MIGKQRILRTGVAGLLLFTCSLCATLYLERIEQWVLEGFMVLRPNSLITDLWESPSMDTAVDLYMFNWTNSEHLNDPTVKPRFEEFGPYRFKEKMQKLNVVWHDENSTVSYMRRSRFDFDEAGSAGRPTDPIVAPNLLIVGIYQKMWSWSPMLRTLMLMTLNLYGKETTMVRPAGDWMFDGFDTPLLKMSKMVPTNLMPELNFPYEKIGYAYPRNGSMEIYGHHNVYTGRQDFSKLGQIARWRYNNVTASSPRCRLKGSAGEFHPIPLEKGRNISYFLPDICRELEVDYHSTTVFEGVEGYVYKGTARNMANGTDNPQNSCYCQDNCQEVRSGLLNISSCWYGAPVFASYPHFHQADPYYVEQVDGMKPDKDRHELVVILEPKTGMILEIKARIMASLLVEPRPSGIYRKSRRTFFPLIWADYHVRITPDLLTYVKLIPIMESLGKVCGCLGIALGLVMMLWYPRQMLWKKLLMQKIEINALDTRTPEQIKGVEESPLLIGVQYVPPIKEGASPS
ncbi:protein peste [Drosophila pseudoobscura]|uniref:Protein peste n=1 Tax=Drosophila pseudoobscura pseudoobscura TaxID=46245 RepID=A0A6I8V851_DROPS|nr:protein peste [Drosophila pseudoobscura]XP_015035805.2 protein peste [Drosophila pseudoobscura]